LSKVKKELADTKAAWLKDKAQVSSLESKVAELEKKLASPFAALLDQASAFASVAKAKLIEVVTELQAGKYEAANKLFLDTLSLASSSLNQAKVFVERELDEHLPAAKKAISEGLTKASSLYDAQIKGKVVEVGKQLSKINEELKALVKGKAQQYPALKPLEDPVNLQLVVYAIIVAPCFLLLLPLLLWMAISFTPDATTKMSSAKGKGPFKPRANKPHKKK
jgi:hypothetical protein